MTTHPPAPKLRPATSADARSLAPILRFQDMAEIKAAAGVSPTTSLLRGVEISEWCQAVELGGRVAALFGVAEMAPGSAASRVGVPWLLGSPAFFREVSAFRLHRQAIAYIRRMHEDFPHLLNVVDARNTTSIQWLSRLGFEFTALHPQYGAGRIPFIQFERFHNVSADSNGRRPSLHGG